VRRCLLYNNQMHRHVFHFTGGMDVFMIGNMFFHNACIYTVECYAMHTLLQLPRMKSSSLRADGLTRVLDKLLKLPELQPGHGVPARGSQPHQAPQIRCISFKRRRRADESNLSMSDSTPKIISPSPYSYLISISLQPIHSTNLPSSNTRIAASICSLFVIITSYLITSYLHYVDLHFTHFIYLHYTHTHTLHTVYI